MDLTSYPPCPPTILLYMPGQEGYYRRFVAKHWLPGWMSILWRLLPQYHRQAVLWVAIYNHLLKVEQWKIETQPIKAIIKKSSTTDNYDVEFIHDT